MPWQGHPHRDRTRDRDQLAGLEEPGVIGPGGKRRHAPVRQACSKAVPRTALAALAVAGPERYPVARLADRDRELLQARCPCHGRPVGAAGEDDLEQGRV